MSCIFCEILRGEAPVSTVYEDDYALAFMDLFPMRPGHTLVIPKQHGVFLEELEPGLRSHLFEIANQVVAAQKQSSLPCAGNNIFVNDGPAANQHVPHVHLHVLPRSGGDLSKAMFTFVSRYSNYFGMAAHRNRLDAIAQELAEKMPTRVSSLHTQD